MTYFVNAIMIYIGFKMPQVSLQLKELSRELPYKLFGHSLVSILISYVLALIEPAFLWIALGHTIHVLKDILPIVPDYTEGH